MWGAPRPPEREWPVGNEAEGARQPGGHLHTPREIGTQSNTSAPQCHQQTNELPGAGEEPDITSLDCTRGPRRPQKLRKDIEKEGQRADLPKVWEPRWLAWN